MSFRSWSCRACSIALVGLLVGCGAGSATTGSAAGTSGGATVGTSGSGGTQSAGGSSPPPQVTGIATPKAVSVVTAN